MGPHGLFLSVFFSLTAMGAVQVPCKHPLRTASSLSFAKIQQMLLRNPDIRTQEEFLACLPEEFRSQFILIYESRALQRRCTTQGRPRVVFFNDTTGFVLTALGNDPTDPRCASPDLEGMEFDYATSSYTFRSIKFNEAKSPDLSEKNPISCLRCHGNDPRPLFDPYFIWPGVYGSNDDNYLTHGNLRDGDPLPFESEEYFKFLKGPHEGVYSQLHWLKRRQIPRSSPSGQNIQLTPYERPNTVFGLKLSNLNALRVSRLATDFPQWEKYKYALIHAAKCDPEDLENWIPDHILKTQRFESPLSSSEYDQFTAYWINGKEIPAGNRSILSRINHDQIDFIESLMARWSAGVPLSYALKYKNPSSDFLSHKPHTYRTLTGYGGYFSDLKDEVLSRPLHLIASLYESAGISMGQWFTTFGGALIANNGASNSLLMLVSAYESKLPEYHGRLTQETCEDLAKKSLKALSK